MWISSRVCDHQAQGSGSFRKTWIQMTTAQRRPQKPDHSRTDLNQRPFFPKCLFNLCFILYSHTSVAWGLFFFTLPILVIECAEDQVLEIYRLLGLWS